MTVRTRFAPSPTGYLHVGGIRTALFAYLVAKQAHGSLILRFEDTDKKREVEGSAQHLIDSLAAIGITYDEGPDKPGEYGPYVQSERLDIYKQWAQKLIDAGRAYADPYTSEEVQAFREQAQAHKQAFLYRNHRPQNPPMWDGTQPLRFRSEPKNYTWRDEVMGEVSTGPDVVDDFILIKSDGYPTYNFAHIVDDAEMKITHVIRGQEFISSMPNFLNLYEALELDLPIFAHLPHVLNEQGNKKLGKRDGAKDILDYIRQGYLPEAMMSFIATLGWNDGTTKEIFSHDELIAEFSLGRVQRSGAHFDVKRLEWINGHFIRSMTIDELCIRVQDFWPSEADTADDTYRKSVLNLVQDRLKTLSDLPLMTTYFFSEPAVNMSLLTDNKQLKKLSLQEMKDLLAGTCASLEEMTDWNAASIQECLNQLLEKTDQKPGVLFSLIRIATTWAQFSPALNDTLALLGKEKTLARIQVAIDSF